MILDSPEWLQRLATLLRVGDVEIGDLVVVGFAILVSVILLGLPQCGRCHLRLVVLYIFSLTV